MSDSKETHCDDDNECCDIVIIGAGLSGLCTARKIEELCILNNKKVPSMIIIEADNRCGGRTKTIKHKGVSLDFGAGWIGSTHNILLNLLKKLNLSSNIYKQYNLGNKILDINNKQSLFKTEIPTPVGLISLIDIQLIIWDIERIAKYNKKYKEYLDSITVESLICSLNIWTNCVKQLTNLLIRLTVGCECGQVSALQFINMIKQSQYSIDTLSNINNGYQQYSIFGGTQQISQNILKQLLLQKKTKIIYNNCVFRIDQNDENDECVVYYAQRRINDDINPTVKINDISLQNSCLNLDKMKKIKTKYVVSACPLYINGKYINFNPKLPLKLNNLFSKCYQGNYWKAYAFFDECFWKKYGFSGEIMTDSKNGPILLCLDKDTSYINNDKFILNKYWNGKAIYCLVALNGGNPTIELSLKTKKQRENIFINQLSLYFNKLIPQNKRNNKDIVRKHFIEYLDMKWIDCGPFDIYPPGSGLNNFKINENDKYQFIHKNIHFASTNLGLSAAGYMEGAISSGYQQGEIIFNRMYNNLNIIKKQQDDDDININGVTEMKYIPLKKMLKRALYVSIFVACTGYFVYKYAKRRKRKLHKF